MTVVENATNSATEIAKNTSRDIIGSSLGESSIGEDSVLTNII